jgi:CPA2 family monovalent cation:H+ antiporter-2
VASLAEKREVEILYKERKYRGPILMLIFFRMGLAVFYISIEYIFLQPLPFALITALLIYFFSQRNCAEAYHKK